ncbi:hypothetical protein [Dysgonomonas sp. GY617]|uniref:hypothetical protein n=1 Tax=Dysgonomonas sp. GY617 TaxID=2780420 RepID=UPI001883D7D6|nr:hypothetical protein [Dysgonomonas sp. GY617]MBF0578109.1 hypothetical protein [Dysgonomonas sp. GY617]
MMSFFFDLPGMINNEGGIYLYGDGLSYGGMNGVRRIIWDEVLILSDKDIAFVCTAFNLKKEELKCYIHKQSRQALMNS